MALEDRRIDRREAACLRGSVAAGDAEHAATMATRLSIEHFVRGDPAVGAGWLMKAQRHAEDVPEGVGHGFLLIVEATVARYSGELSKAQELIGRAAEIGLRFRDPDLLAMAIHTEGILLILEGETERGVALLDEAMTSVVSGQLTPYFTGIVYCNVIGTCLEIADVRRADQWSEAARAWCESLPPESPFPGMCRVNRAEVARLRGAWSEAEAEATRASEELMPSIRWGRRRPSTRRVRSAGGSATSPARRSASLEPARSASIRSRGSPSSASHRARRRPHSEPSGSSVTTARESRLQRAGSSPRWWTSPSRCPDLDAAAGAADQLSELAAGSGASILQAMAATATGAVQLARGDAPAAVDSLRRAGAMWRDLRLPYEAARARVLFGLALRAAGDEDDAVLAFRSAIGAFDRLGAVPDRDAATALLPGTTALPGGLTSREAQVLRLVAAGNSNREIAAELVISEHTVARHLQNIFAKLDVSSRSGATAFAFEHDLA